MAKYYYQFDGSVHGPYSPDELKVLAASGELPIDALIRRGSSGKWHPTTAIGGLHFPDSKVIPVWMIKHPLLKQINACYDHEFYDACVMLYLRMVDDILGAKTLSYDSRTTLRQVRELSQRMGLSKQDLLPWVIGMRKLVSELAMG
jgi:hypothetical protein